MPMCGAGFLLAPQGYIKESKVLHHGEYCSKFIDELSDTPYLPIEAIATNLHLQRIHPGLFIGI